MGALRLLGVGLVVACAGCSYEPPTTEELLALGDPPPCSWLSEDIALGPDAGGCWLVRAAEPVLTTVSVTDSCEARSVATSCLVVPAPSSVRFWFESLDDENRGVTADGAGCDAACP